mgnify:CR=1 FL=1
MTDEIKAITIQALENAETGQYNDDPIFNTHGMVTDKISNLEKAFKANQLDLSQWKNKKIVLSAVNDFYNDVREMALPSSDGKYNFKLKKLRAAKEYYEYL